MLFDFELFKRLVKECYEPGPFTLDETLRVFYLYFREYEEVFGRPHPSIRKDQIRRIIHVMPYIDPEDIGAYHADIDAEAYSDIIERHFRTRYRHCDFNINHFFSGSIRLHRFFESECRKNG